RPRQAQSRGGRTYADRVDRGGIAPGTYPRQEAEGEAGSTPDQQGNRGADAWDRPRQLICPAGVGRSRIRRADEGFQVILPDVNVLIYAFRSDVPQHP